MVTPVNEQCNTFFMFIHLKKPEDDDHKSKIRNLVNPIHLPTPQRSWNNKILKFGSEPMMLKEQQFKIL